MSHRQSAAAATAEKGQEYLGIVLDRISGFLVEVTKTTMNEEFPY